MAPHPSYYHCDRDEVVRIMQPQGKRILDVGCAAGAMGALLRRQGATEVVGIERHPEACATARTRLHAVYRFDLGDMPDLPYEDGYFDYITCTDVLEHLPDPGTTLHRLRRYLASDGQLVVSIPNVRHESVVLPLLVKGRWDYVDAGILDRTHLRFFTKHSMLAFLSEAGFRVLDPMDAVCTSPSPDMEKAAAFVAQMGGDAAAFTQEAVIIQYLARALPRDANSATKPVVALQDPWRDSSAVKALLVPDLAQPTERWMSVLAGVLAGGAANSPVTVGVALPAQTLHERLPDFQALSSLENGDLLLIELPPDQAARQRLLAGCSMFVLTSEQPEWVTLANHIGVQVLGGR